MIIGDLLIVGEPPLKFIKALGVIAIALHPSFDKIVTPGKSKESCVLCSLTVRDFLWKAGFKDARVVTVYTAIRAVGVDGVEIHSLGVGDHNGTVPTLGGRTLKDTPERWSGHMVVEVPSVGYMVDTTMFNMKRPAWPDLPGMIATPIERDGVTRSFGLDHLACIRTEIDDGVQLMLWWLVQPNERWRDAPDTERHRRLSVVKAMLRLFTTKAKKSR